MPFWRVRKTDRRPQWRCLDDKGLPMWMGATEHAEVFANKEKALEALADAIDKEREVMKKKPKEENPWWLKIDAQWMRAHPKGRLDPMRWENISVRPEIFLAPEEARGKTQLWFGRLGNFWLGPVKSVRDELSLVEDLGQAQGFSSKETLDEALELFDDSQRANVDGFVFEMKAISAHLGADPSDESKALARKAEERDLGRTVGAPERKGLGRKRLWRAAGFKGREMGQIIKKAQFKKPTDKSQVFALARYEVSVVVEPRAKKTTGAAGEWLASNTSAICFSAGLALVCGSSKDVREWLWELAQGNVDGDPESSAHLRPGQKEWESARAVLWESVLDGEEIAPSLIQLEASARICLDGKWRPALVMWRKGCILKTKGGTAKGSERAKKMIEAMPKKMASKAKELGLVFEELDFDDLMSDDWGACACARAGARLEEFEINKALGEGKRARQDGQTQEWARL